MNLQKTSFWLVALLSFPMAFMSFRFLSLGLEPAFEEMIGHIVQHRSVFLAHVIAAPIALAAGVFQFAPKLRARRPALHRWSGRLYVLAILVGGISGFAMAVKAIGGPVAGWGFGLLALGWLFTTATALGFAMKRQIAQHKRWMMRSYALTFAAVTLRIYLPFFLLNGFSYAEASLYVAWMCWVPNLLVMEWFLGRSKPRSAVLT